MKDYYTIELQESSALKTLRFADNKWNEVSDWLKENNFVLVYTDPKYGDRVYKNKEKQVAKLYCKVTDLEYPEYY